MKKLFLLILLISSTGIYAQSLLTVSDNSDRIRVGGGMGLNFGDHGYFGLNISPFIGYEILPELEGGIGVGYHFATSKISKQNLFKVGPYVNYYPTPEFFARVQYEFYSGNHTLKSTSVKRSFDENALWIGAGYQSVGRVRFYAGMMYNLLYKSDSRVFSNAFQPILGVNVGI